MLRDIREQKKEIEQALVDSENRFRSLFDNKHTPMFLSDLKKNLSFLEVNPAAMQLLGYSKAQLLQMKMTDITTLSAQQIAERMGKIDELDKLKIELPIRKSKWRNG